MAQIINLSDKQLTNAMATWIEDADANMLAHIAGIMFGGACEVSDTELSYEFTPDSDYNGAFDELAV